MSTILEYKCPCCGGAVSFDSTQQKMVCPYCDAEFDIEALKNLQNENDDSDKQPERYEWDVQPGNQWGEDELKGINLYTCQSCGGELIADENTGATNCPYCDNQAFPEICVLILLFPSNLTRKRQKRLWRIILKESHFYLKFLRIRIT